MRVPEVPPLSECRWEICEKIHTRWRGSILWCWDRALCKYGSRNVGIYRMIGKWGFSPVARACDFRIAHRARWYRQGYDWMWACEAPYRSDEHTSRKWSKGKGSSCARGRDGLDRVMTLVPYPPYIRWRTLLSWVAWDRRLYCRRYASRSGDPQVYRLAWRWRNSCKRGDTRETAHHEGINNG